MRDVAGRHTAGLSTTRLKTLWRVVVGNMLSQSGGRRIPMIRLCSYSLCSLVFGFYRGTSIQPPRQLDHLLAFSKLFYLDFRASRMMMNPNIYVIMLAEDICRGSIRVCPVRGMSAN